MGGVVLVEVVLEDVEEWKKGSVGSAAGSKNISCVGVVDSFVYD